MDPADFEDVIDVIELANNNIAENANNNVNQGAPLPPIMLLQNGAAAGSQFVVRSVHHEVVLHVECVEHFVAADFEILSDATQASYTVSVPLLSQAETLVRAVRAVISGPHRPDRIIDGQARRREEGTRMFREAVAAGKTAFLARDARQGAFTWSLGNVERGERVRFTMSMLCPGMLRKADVAGAAERCSVFRVAVPGTGGDDAVNIFRLPAGLAAAAAAATGAGEEPVGLGGAATWSTELTLTVRTTELLAPYVACVRCSMGDSPFAEVTTWPNSTLLVERARMPLRGDSITVYVAAFLPASAGVHVVAAPIAPALQPAAERKAGQGLEGMHYALALSLLDQRYPAPALEQAAHVVFALDMSGSMFFQGNRAYKAIRAMITLMQLLPPGSSAAVVMWGSQIKWVNVNKAGVAELGSFRFNEPQCVFPVTPTLLDAMRAGLLRGERAAIRDLGGTDVGIALRAAKEAADAMARKGTRTGPTRSSGAAGSGHGAGAGAGGAIAGVDAGGAGGGVADAVAEAGAVAAAEAEGKRTRVALSNAINDARRPAAESTILLLTDGQFNTPSMAVGAHRLAVVGVGSECNATQLRELAARHNGAACVLPDAMGDAAMTLRLQELVTDVLSPVRVVVSVPGCDGALLSAPEEAQPLPVHTPITLFALCPSLPTHVRITTMPPSQSFDVPVSLLDVTPPAETAAAAGAGMAAEHGSGDVATSSVIATGPGAWVVLRAAHAVAAAHSQKSGSAWRGGVWQVGEQLGVGNKALDTVFVAVENVRPAREGDPGREPGVMVEVQGQGGGMHIDWFGHVEPGLAAPRAGPARDASTSESGESDEDEDDDDAGAGAGTVVRMHAPAAAGAAVLGSAGLARGGGVRTRMHKGAVKKEKAAMTSVGAHRALTQPGGGGGPVFAPAPPARMPKSMPQSQLGVRGAASDGFTNTTAFFADMSLAAVQDQVDEAELAEIVEDVDALSASVPSARTHERAADLPMAFAGAMSLATSSSSSAAAAGALSRRNAASHPPPPPPSAVDDMFQALAPAPPPPAPRPTPSAASAPTTTATATAAATAAASAQAEAAVRKLMDMLRGDHWECDAALPVPADVWAQVATQVAALGSFIATTGLPDASKLQALRSSSPSEWQQLCAAVTKAVLAHADTHLLPKCTADLRVLFRNVTRAARRYKAV